MKVKCAEEVRYSFMDANAAQMEIIKYHQQKVVLQDALS
jgi:hypothetical protein